MYGYIYKTTNLINNKIYIGQHKSEKFVGNNYLGSGVLFKKAVEKYGKNNFQVELLQECFSKGELDRQEIKWIAEFNSTDREIGYNLSIGGLTGTSTPEINERRHNSLMGHAVSDVTKQKISIAKKEFYNTDNGKVLKQQLSDKYQGHEPWNKGKKMSEEYCEISKKSHPKGWYNHTDETKQQISNTLKEKYASGELVPHEGIGKKRCKNLDTGEVFDSLAEAAKKYHISNPNNIVKCSDGKFKTTGGHHWILLE